MERTFKSVNQAIERRSMHTKTLIISLIFLLSIPLHLLSQQCEIVTKTLPLTEVAYNGSSLFLEQRLHELPVTELPSKVNQADEKNKFTPLMYAAVAAHNAPTMVDLLLTHQADTNTQEFRGLTAPMLAAQTENVTVLQLLLKKGEYNDTIADNTGKILADHARNLHNEKVHILTLLLRRNFEKIIQKHKPRTYAKRALEDYTAKTGKPIDASDIAFEIEKYLGK